MRRLTLDIKDDEVVMWYALDGDFVPLPSNMFYEGGLVISHRSRLPSTAGGGVSHYISPRLREFVNDAPYQPKFHDYVVCEGAQLVTSRASSDTQLSEDVDLCVLLKPGFRAPAPGVILKLRCGNIITKPTRPKLRDIVSLVAKKAPDNTSFEQGALQLYIVRKERIEEALRIMSEIHVSSVSYFRVLNHEVYLTNGIMGGLLEAEVYRYNFSAVINPSVPSVVNVVSQDHLDKSLCIRVKDDSVLYLTHPRPTPQGVN